MPNPSTFQVTYEGPALANHEMNVKDLAPALLAIGELLEDANRILNGEKAKLAVNIRATEPGSVIITLSAVQNLLHQAVSLFSSDEATALVNAADILRLLGLISGSGAGVIGLLKWLKNRKVKSVTKIDTGDFKLEAEDGEVRITNEREIKLFSFVTIRKNLEAVVTPLRREGVDKVSFRHDQESNAVTKDEVEYLKAPAFEQEVIDQSELEENLQIVTISFQEGGKWRFSDGNATFYAEIQDQDFLAQVALNQTAFAKDDILKVRLTRKQYLLNGTIKADYVITKVIDHRSALVQIPLPFKNSD
jgi:hypothetical protein